MAGRFVVIEFEDRDSAEAFAENETLGRQLGFKTLALFLKPKVFCDCPDKKRQDARNWQKGKRTGLFLCKTCKRPSRFHQRGMMKQLEFVFGYNQLAIEPEEE